VRSHHCHTPLRRLWFDARNIAALQEAQGASGHHVRPGQAMAVLARFGWDRTRSPSRTANDLSQLTHSGAPSNDLSGPKVSPPPLHLPIRPVLAPSQSERSNPVSLFTRYVALDDIQSAPVGTGARWRRTPRYGTPARSRSARHYREQICLWRSQDLGRAGRTDRRVLHRPFNRRFPSDTFSMPLGTPLEIRRT